MNFSMRTSVVPSAPRGLALNAMSFNINQV
jgi:hypothetical protein